MLDSTGRHWTIRIPCFLCNCVHFEADAYQPEWGHAAESLRHLPACIAPHSNASIKNLKGAKLFLIEALDNSVRRLSPGKRNANLVQFKATDLHQSREAYHYGGYSVPNFGTNIGQALYVCPQCVENNKQEGGILEYSLQFAFRRHFNQRCTRLIDALFWSGVLWDGICPTKIRRAARLKLLSQDRKEFAKQASEIAETMRKLPRGSARGVKPLKNICTAFSAFA